VVGLSQGLSRLEARVFQYLPGRPFNLDNFLSLQVDSICQHNGLADLGITPTPIEAVVPGYL
jgi:NADH dehydrogenase